MGEGEFEGMLFAPLIKSLETAGEVDIKKEVADGEWRVVEKGFVADGNMIILPFGESQKVDLRSLHGDELGSGKWSVVFDDGPDNISKVFKDAQSFYACCEFVFMKRYGGKAGLPEFRGATINGYVAEKIKGFTLEQMMLNGTSDAENSILSRDQAQSLLDTIAEYHRVTGRVHGDLVTAKGPENIMIDENGKVRLLDTEWERVGLQTPELELRDMSKWLFEKFGFGDLVVPETISDQAARANLDNFLAEVEQMTVRDSRYNRIILGFKDNVLNVRVSDGRLEYQSN